MAPKRSTKRSFEESELEDSSRLPKQSKLSSGSSSRPEGSLATPPVSSSPQRERGTTRTLKTKKAAARKPAGRKSAAAEKAPTANKVYKDALKAVDKMFNGLMKRYKPNPTGWSGITADDFSADMCTFIPTVKQLSEESISDAFNLLLDMGEHAYGDLEACFKASGFGDTDEPFQKMDNLLVELITARDEAQATDDDDDDDDDDKSGSAGGNFTLQPSTADFGDKEQVIRDCLGGKKYPNKRERGELDRVRREDLKIMFKTRRARRETVEDWAGNALNDLAETRKRIGAYGIGDDYFRHSIELLASMKGVETPGYDEYS